MQSQPRKRDSSYTVEVARSYVELLEHVEAWDRLAERAIHPNVFYESAIFLTAVKNFASRWRLCCVFIYRKNDGSSRELIGFFPFLGSRKGPFGAVRFYHLVNHIHCFLCSPLVAKNELNDVVAALHGWMDSAPDGVRIFGFYKMAVDDELGSYLAKQLIRKNYGFREFTYQRALLVPNNSGEQYLRDSLKTKKRKEYRRLLRRLESIGPVTFEVQTDDCDERRWTHQFLDMELSGWKRKTGFAMGQTKEGVDTFYDLVDFLGSRDRLVLHTMHVAGEPIAMKINLLSADGRGIFAFKIAYDEEFAKYSPGVLLELENINDLHRRAGIEWADSCADPNHPMIDHLWRERREIGYILCAGRGFLGWLMMALFRLRNRAWKRRMRELNE